MLVFVSLMLGLKVKFESGIVHCCGICVCDSLHEFIVFVSLPPTRRDGGAEGRGKICFFIFLKKKVIIFNVYINNLFFI